MHRSKQRNYSIDRFVPNWHTVQQSHAQRAARGERWSSANVHRLEMPSARTGRRQEAFLKPWSRLRAIATYCAASSGVPGCKKPISGIFGCCARTARGVSSNSANESDKLPSSHVRPMVENEAS